MTIVGRVTRDATVHHTRDDRPVVHFDLAINEFYRPKGQEESVKQTTFMHCSYWINPKMAERIRKGCLLEIIGHPSVQAFLSNNQEARASLNCHVHSVRIHYSPKGEDLPAIVDHAEPATGDDLPF